MNRNTLIPLLLILSIASIGYAIYRSTALRITTFDANNTQTVYGDSQHGLMLGLCLFAGICLFTIAYLIDRDRDINRDTVVRREERGELRRTLSGDR